MKSTGLKEIGVLDSLRGFAACSVMVFHFVCTTVGYFPSPWIQKNFDYARSGVQLFFVISGFILPWAMYRGGYTLDKFFKFFLKRLSRLEPPYIVSVFTALALLWIRSRVMGESLPTIEGGRVAAHFFYLIPFFDDYAWLNRVYWTLAVEFQYYIFIALLFPLLVSGRWISRLGIYLLCLAGPWLSFEDFLPFSLPFFLMGISLFLYMEDKIGIKEFISVLTACIIAVLMTNTTAATIYSLAGVFIIYNWPAKKPKFLTSLGKMSYSIYLFHTLIGATVVNVLSHKYTEPYQKILVVFAGIAVSLISAAIMYYLVERPSKRLAASIKYKSSK